MPQGFVASLKPPDDAVLVGARIMRKRMHLLVKRQKIMYKWEGVAWCVGKVRGRNSDSR